MHYKSAHPKALKDSIAYSQALSMKQICSKTSEAIKHLKDLKNAFIKRGYQSKILGHHFERAMSVDWKILLEHKEKPSTHLPPKNHSKVTGQKKPFKYFTILLQKWKPNLFAPMPSVYANFSKLQKVRHISTPTSIIIGRMPNHKPQFCCVNIVFNKMQNSL